ncbi:hypothetical protein HK100_002349 [Physocladia obscura]|uniref:Uncharacterized protein n=1 Tax=Physocladia obscura TaxID=109957 RepID=A0AAD5XB49_9FUNG|nr:hypothetical protein HK100_002349 [Physocladia obscura]
MNCATSYPTRSTAPAETVEEVAAAVMGEYTPKTIVAHQYTINETFKNATKNSTAANTHRLAGIAIIVMGILTQLAVNSCSNNNNSYNGNINSNNNAAFSQPPICPYQQRHQEQSQHDATLKRLVAVFIGCSIRASPARQQALPTTVVTALLLVHRVVRKVVDTNSSDNKNNGSRNNVPQDVLDIVHSPVDLFLAVLILAESSLSDTQTSTTSWARLYNQSGIVTSEGRKQVANLKWTVFEWLDYSIDISRDTFMRWCSLIRRWIGEYPPAAVSGVPGQTCAASYVTMQQTNSMFVPSIELVETPATSPTTPVSPEILPSASLSTDPLFIGGIYIHSTGTISFDPKSSSTVTTPTNNISISASTQFNLSVSLNPPQFSLSCRTSAAKHGSSLLSSSRMANESAIASNTSSYRTQPYQRPTNNARLFAHQRVL